MYKKCTNNVETKNYKRNCIVLPFAYLAYANVFIRVLKMVRFSEGFWWYGKEFQNLWAKVYQTICSKSYLIRLWYFWIQFIFFSYCTIRHSQLENILYETRINIIESFENFNTQTTIVETYTVLFPDFFK